MDVEGELVVDGYDASNQVILTALDSEDPWCRIEFTNLADADFEYFELSYAGDGLDFQDDATGSVSNGYIHHVEDYGVKLTTGETYTFEDLTIRHCDYAGISVTGGSDLDLSDSEIDSNYIGMLFTSSDGTVNTCTFRHNEHEGLAIRNAAPIFEECDFYANGENGIAAILGSDITLGVKDDEYGNLFQENGSAASDNTEGAELYLYNSTPVLKGCHNSFIDASLGNNQYLLYTNDLYGSLDGSGNYWEGYSYTPPDASKWFSPLGYVTGEQSWDNTSHRTIYTADQYWIALQSEEQGDYETASENYWVSATEDANSGALRRWIQCQLKLGEDREEILDGIESLVETNNELATTAFWSSIYVQNLTGDFASSISQLEDFIETAPTAQDSVYGLLEELTTYYLMALAEEQGNSTFSSDELVDRNNRPFNLEKIGRYSYPVPSNLADYKAKERALLSTARHPELITDSISLPREYALLSAYPNPFNPTTQIQFDLVRPEIVKLSVYNIMGQEVTKLVDRPMSAGTHSVTFDASNLASGMYFYRIEAGPFTDMKRMVLVK